MLPEYRLDIRRKTDSGTPAGRKQQHQSEKTGFDQSLYAHLDSSSRKLARYSVDNKVYRSNESGRDSLAAF
jgi:hypothetical protein